MHIKNNNPQYKTEVINLIKYLSQQPYRPADLSAVWCPLPTKGNQVEINVECRQIQKNKKRKQKYNN